MIRAGLCSVTFRALQAESVIGLAAETGVEAIEWGGDIHVPPGDLATASHIGATCRDHGIAACSYGSYVRAGCPGARDDFDAALASAEALGAGNIRVWAGRKKRADAGCAAFEAAAGDLAAMARAAQAKNITVCVEYHRNSLTEEAGDAAALLKAADAENLFSYWQPVPGRGVPRWLEEMTILSPWLGDLHVFHWIIARSDQMRRPLQEGIADWCKFFAHWPVSTRWPHPRTAFLEFVRHDSIEQYRSDISTLHKIRAQ